MAYSQTANAFFSNIFSGIRNLLTINDLRRPDLCKSLTTNDLRKKKGRKSLYTNDLRNHAGRNPLTVNDLRIIARTKKPPTNWTANCPAIMYG